MFFKMNGEVKPAALSKYWQQQKMGGAMATHAVNMRTPELDVPKVDVIFEVKRNGSAFGRLRVSKGGVEWMQNNDKKIASHMRWEDVD